MTTALWTMAELLAATGGTLDGAAPAQISGVSIDTRSLRAGDLFVALRDVRDGHAFVGAAFEAGAAAALVADGYTRRPEDGALIRVDDPLTALERLGIAARLRANDARVVAITGSAGKTTTKEMLRAVFEAMAPGRVHASEKSYNNHWGVPLTLARMPADTRFAVFEIGMNHAGEIHPLATMVRPQVAVVTTVAPAHLGHFESEAGIAEAKAEIFAGLEPARGFAILPRDNAHFELLRARAAAALGTAVDGWSIHHGIFSFGEHAEADQGIDVARSEFRPDGTDVVMRFGAGDRQPVHTFLGVAGRHNASNAAAALAAWLVATIGLDLPTTPGEAMPGLGLALEALATLELDPAGRGQVHQLAGGPVLIDESYNANPASVRAALETLALYPPDRRRVAVLGDMLELGERGPDLHAGLAAAIRAARVDLVLSAGPLMRHLHDVLPLETRGAWAATSAELERALLDAIRPGDVVMVKGSNGSRMAPLTAALKDRYAKAAGEG